MGQHGIMTDEQRGATGCFFQQEGKERRGWKPFVGQRPQGAKRTVQNRAENLSRLAAARAWRHADATGANAQGPQGQTDPMRLVEARWCQTAEIIGFGGAGQSGPRIPVSDEGKVPGDHSAISRGPPTFCLPSFRVQRYTPGRNCEGAGMDHRK